MSRALGTEAIFGLRHRVDVYWGRETVLVPLLEGGFTEAEAGCSPCDVAPGTMIVALADSPSRPSPSG